MVDVYRASPIDETVAHVDVLGVEREGKDAAAIGEAGKAGRDPRDILLAKEGLVSCDSAQPSKGRRGFRRTVDHEDTFTPGPVDRFHHCRVSKRCHVSCRLVVKGDDAGARCRDPARAKTGVGRDLVCCRDHRFAGGAEEEFPLALHLGTEVRQDPVSFRCDEQDGFGPVEKRSEDLGVSLSIDNRHREIGWDRGAESGIDR